MEAPPSTTTDRSVMPPQCASTEPIEILRPMREFANYFAFRKVTDDYGAAFRAGDGTAVAQMIDFLGGERKVSRGYEHAAHRTELHGNRVSFDSGRGE